MSYLLKPLIAALFCGLFLFSVGCNSHEAITTFEPEGGCWSSSDTLTLSFEATDTTQPYKLYFPTTFTEDYGYNNIYVHMVTIPPGKAKSDLQYRFNVMDATGVWLGEQSGDQATVENMVGEGVKFSELGTYTFKLYHYMRDELLCGVAATSIAIDKMGE